MRNARFAGTLQSPLTDSNRRPPPYHRKPWQPISPYLSRFRRRPICHPLPPLATALLHKRSIRVVGLGYAEGAMLSRPAAVSLASRRLRKWGREGGTRRGRSERPCSASARSSSMRRRTLRCASAASRRTGSGTSAVDPPVLSASPARLAPHEGSRPGAGRARPYVALDRGKLQKRLHTWNVLDLGAP